MLHRVLSPLTDVAYTLLRLIAGALFMCHGMQKCFGWMGGVPPDKLQMQIGGWIELTAGGLVSVGLLTRLAAFVASGQMAVAYIQFHWLGDGAHGPFEISRGPGLQKGHVPGPSDSFFFPAVNGGEAALLYCFLFLFIACRGVGAIGLDRIFCRRCSEPKTAA